MLPVLERRREAHIELAARQVIGDRVLDVVDSVRTAHVDSDHIRFCHGFCFSFSLIFGLFL